MIEALVVFLCKNSPTGHRAWSATFHLEQKYTTLTIEFNYMYMWLINSVLLICLRVFKSSHTFTELQDFNVFSFQSANEILHVRFLTLNKLCLHVQTETFFI